MSSINLTRYIGVQSSTAMKSCYTGSTVPLTKHAFSYNSSLHCASQSASILEKSIFIQSVVSEDFVVNDWAGPPEKHKVTAHIALRPPVAAL